MSPPQPGAGTPLLLLLLLTALLPWTCSGTGSVPHIHIEEDERRGIRLICSSSGWYPRPRVRWKDPRGHRLPPASEKTHQEGDGLYAAETSFVLAAESKENVSCFIQNPLLDLDKEMRISVADSLFPRVSLEKTVLIVIVTVLFFLLSSSAYVHWIRHRAKEALQEECEKLREDLKRRKLLGEEVDVTLDPSSADLYLIVSEDKKAVRSVGKKLDLADLEDRFDNPFAVLGHQRFDRGCHYWEVGVEGKTRWTLGLCKQSIPRKGRYISASPESGFWALSPKNTDNYQALTSSRAPIYVIEPPRAVGIFLEYEEGRVSFCNVTEGTWLYTFKASFTETLRPYFYPGPLSKGKNVNPLIILPRPREGRGARSDGPSTQESKPLMDGDGQHGEESETR
ncbi:butyrophilin subfamily 1 member A1-like isoform X2 [Ornithorhynchus anatinus]|uniref:butyrophilin subfamily 1 member A1-like isoform X2 n=1 Tax=Ornithorhynchus anatinus TaxID=9258 RepID=UPI0010A8E946|nr:butyrophilin subfamily 1 member A1-like isoform X2 [Ornithorhynchus anatinus]